MKKCEKIVEKVKGKNALIQKNRVLSWQRLGVIVCLISVNGVPRFLSFSNSEVSLNYYYGIVEVNRVSITPRMN